MNCVASACDLTCGWSVDLQSRRQSRSIGERRWLTGMKRGRTSQYRDVRKLCDTVGLKPCTELHNSTQLNLTSS